MSDVVIMRQVKVRKINGFEMIYEDGTLIPSLWKRSTGFKEKEEVADDPVDEISIPPKKIKLLLPPEKEK